MKCVICGQPIEEGRKQGQPPRLAEYCLKCRTERRRRARVKYTWLPEHDAYLKAHYFGGLNRRFQVLTRVVRMTGLPRWYIKRQASRLGLTMKMDRRSWTQAELDHLENLVGRVSSATIAKRLHRPESSIVNKLKRLGTSRRVRDGYTMRELELCLGEDHHKIAGWIQNGWLQDRLQGTHRHNGNGNDIHRIREQDILDFIRNHPQEINLGKVDQTWFLDLVLLKGREVREVTFPRSTHAGEDDGTGSQLERSWRRLSRNRRPSPGSHSTGTPEYDDCVTTVRKIVHVDMDAFYASVEQRDDPQLRGKPVVVAWRGNRSVVCAASYEARKFGVRSAMPAVRAERLCPNAVFLPPDFPRYRAVSRQAREIFQRHTNLIEPLSLDEAYLDVSENKTGLPTATQVARTIREQICSELSLTASAGVAPNKFLAKIASDWKKPDGLFVIQPEEVDSFLLPLPVNRLPGVGKVTEEKLKHLEVHTIADLRQMDLPTLEGRFGRYGVRLYELARGIDNSEVVPDRPTQSISAEDTFEQDVLLTEMEPMVRKLAEHTWTASRKESRIARTVVLKLKTSEFKILTRSHTPGSPPSSCEELTNIALSLRERVGLSPQQRFRLVGVGLSNFCDPEDASAQPALFT